MDNEEQTESSKKKAEQYLDTIFDSSLVEIKCSFQALKKSERLIVLHSSGDVKSFIMISCLNKDCAANILSHIGLENKNAVAFFCTMPL